MEEFGIFWPWGLRFFGYWKLGLKPESRTMGRES